MSSYMAPYNSTGNQDVDPMTGLPKVKKPGVPKPQGFGAPDPWMVAAGLAPPSGSAFGPSGGGGPPAPGTPGAPPAAPDYMGLINNDLSYKQLLSDTGAQGVSDAASRAAATQRALVLFGQVPQFGGLSNLNSEWIGQDVNDTTRQAAQANTTAGMSITARQKDAFDKNLRAVKNALAARGALRSGEAGYQLGEAQKTYDTASYDTTQQLVDYIAGLQAGYAQQQRLIQQRQGEGAAEAARRIPPGTVAPPAATAGNDFGGGAASSEQLARLIAAARRKSNENQGF